MSRQIGDRYHCPKCGAQLVYERPCPCPEGSPHAELCCGEQMKRVEEAVGTSPVRPVAGT